MEYVGRLVDHEGVPVLPGSPAWEKLSERVSAAWGVAIAWRRDHLPEGAETSLPYQQARGVPSLTREPSEATDFAAYANLPGGGAESGTELMFHPRHPLAHSQAPRSERGVN
ncbi:MAG TPA: hypothetical protein VK821_02805, partial [Dehalococcoidia bacterium]|nr:hypothetical protein [Dehalococcoidia bacterium]